jgi:hypothetical protein
MSYEHSTAYARAVSLKPQRWRWGHPPVLTEHDDMSGFITVT